MRRSLLCGFIADFGKYLNTQISNLYLDKILSYPNKLYINGKRIYLAFRWCLNLNFQKLTLLWSRVTFIKHCSYSFISSFPCGPCGNLNEILWGIFSPSRKTPDCMNSYWNDWISPAKCSRSMINVTLSIKVWPVILHHSYNGHTIYLKVLIKSKCTFFGF